MADKEAFVEGTEMKDENDAENSDVNVGIQKEKPSSLEQFIMDNYEQQKNEGRLVATETIDDARTENFYSRALQESRRMCGEVEKSKMKMGKLHTELGAANLAAWRTEHAAEVLLPEEAEKIALADQIYAQS